MKRREENSPTKPSLTPPDTRFSDPHFVSPAQVLPSGPFEAHTPLSLWGVIGSRIVRSGTRFYSAAPPVVPLVPPLCPAPGPVGFARPGPNLRHSDRPARTPTLRTGSRESRGPGGRGTPAGRSPPRRARRPRGPAGRPTCRSRGPGPTRGGRRARPPEEGERGGAAGGGGGAGGGPTTTPRRGAPTRASRRRPSA